MIEALRVLLATDDRVVFAVLFGSQATGRARPDSDVDVAVQLARPLSALELGGLVADLEDVAGRRVDLVDLDHAGPSLSWRVFRDGRLLMCRDRAAFVDRKARAITEYLDWKPIEDVFVQGVLSHGR